MRGDGSAASLLSQNRGDADGKEETERKGKLKKEHCFGGFHCQRSHT